MVLLVWLFATCVVFATAAVVGHYVGAGQATFLWAYCFTATFEAAGAVAQMHLSTWARTRLWGGSPPSFDATLGRLARGNKLIVWLKHARYAVGQTLWQGSRALTWPDLFLTCLLGAASGSIRLSAAAPNAEKLRTDVAASLFTTGAVLGVFAFAHFSAVGPSLLSWFLALFFAALVARHIAYIFMPRLLLQSLRVASERPQYLFAAVFLCDFAALAGMLPVVALGHAPSTVTFAEISEGVRAALSQSGWEQLVTGADLSAKNIAVNVAGLAFKIALVGSLISGLTVGRTMDDVEQLAYEQFERRELQAAEATLSRIGAESQGSSFLRANIALVQGDMEKAKAALSTWLVIERMAHSPERIYGVLKSLALGLNSASVWRTVLCGAVSDRVKDVHLALLLNSVSGHGFQELTRLDLFGGREGWRRYASEYRVTLELLLRTQSLHGVDTSEDLEALRSIAPVPAAGVAKFVHVALCEVGLSTDALPAAIRPYAVFLYSRYFDQLEELLGSIRELDDLAACHEAARGAVMRVLVDAHAVSEQADRLLSIIERRMEAREERLPLVDTHEIAVEVMREAAMALQQQRSTRLERPSLLPELQRVVGAETVGPTIAILVDRRIQDMLAAVGAGSDPAWENKLATDLEASLNIDLGSIKDASRDVLERKIAAAVECRFSDREHRLGAQPWAEIQTTVLLSALNDAWRQSKLTQEDVWALLSDSLDVAPGLKGSVPTPGLSQLAESVVGQLMHLHLPDAVTVARW